MNLKIITTILLAFSLLLINKVNAQDVYAGKNTKVEKDISADFPFESKFINLGTDLTLCGIGRRRPSNMYAPPKIVPVIIRDYSLTFGKKQYEKDTIFGDANSYHSSVA